MFREMFSSLDLQSALSTESHNTAVTLNKGFYPSTLNCQSAEVFPGSFDGSVQLRYRLTGGGGRRIETPSRWSGPAYKPRKII